MRQLLRRIIIGSIKFYQYAISGILGPRCRFHPSCSQYTIEAIEKLPFHKAILYSIWRILRCHPFSKGGEDKVPKN